MSDVPTISLYTATITLAQYHATSEARELPNEFWTPLEEVSWHEPIDRQKETDYFVKLLAEEDKIPFRELMAIREDWEPPHVDWAAHYLMSKGLNGKGDYPSQYFVVLHDTRTLMATVIQARLRGFVTRELRAVKFLVNRG